MNHLSTIPAKIFAHVQAYPERSIIHYRDLESDGAGSEEALTYGELWSQAAAFAQHLEILAQDDHAMIVMPLRPQLLVAHLAVMMQSAVASIFTHPSSKIADNVYSDKLRHAIDVFHPKVIITNKDFLEIARRAVNDDEITIVLYSDDASTDSSIEQRWITTDASATAILQYSSGSTGMQKAVALSHEMVIGQCESYAQAIQLNQNDKICSWLPLYHDMGLFTSWLMPILHAIPVFLIDPFQWVKQPLSLFRLITDIEGTLCWLPNFAFNLLAQRTGFDELPGINLSTMRGFVNCSEPISARSFEYFQSVFGKIGVKPSALWSCYAMTENSFAVSSGHEGSAMSAAVRLDMPAFRNGDISITNAGEIILVSCGRPIKGTDASIVDMESGETSSGRIGEIVVKSPYMLRGYCNAPEMSKAAIDSKGWYHTGDLGFIHDGNIFVTGRKKDLLIVGGKNIYPQDIEGICDRMKNSIQGRSAALGVKDEKLGTEKIILLIESHLADDASKSKLSRDARKAIMEELDCPLAKIHVVPHMWLIKTSSGKIARQPNLDKYTAEFPPRENVAIEKSQVAPVATNWMAMFGWTLAFSLAIYFVILIRSMGTNPSWNVYMGF